MSYSRTFRIWILAAILVVSGLAAVAFADPSSRVARLSFVGGSVAFRPGTLDDWSTPPVNYPLTTGDNLWTDPGGRAELQLGATTIRIAAETSLTILNIDDNVMQLRVAQGSATVTVRSMRPNEIIEVDLPQVAASITSPGFYRFDVPPTGDRSAVTVRHGQAQIAAGPTVSTVYEDQSFVVADTGMGTPAVQLQGIPIPDEWEDWCLTRDRIAANVTATRYVSRDMVGYEDLDQFGAWQLAQPYGWVWMPRVNPGWAPYRYGHWAWVEPWGWTWMDDAPWGFAPFHYGRWVAIRNQWAWIPGAVAARPVYAPALVVFVGGGAGVGAPLGWFPLGPSEPFVPAYHVAPAYVVMINAPHVQVTQGLDVTRVTYVNRTAPGAVTVVSQETFVQGRPVAASMTTGSIEMVQRGPVIAAAPFAPTQVSVVGAAVVRRPPPPTAVINRQVVVRNALPPPPVSFAARQQILAAHPGQPVDEQTLHTLQAQRPAAMPPNSANRPAPGATPRPNVAPGPSGAPANGGLAGRHATEQAQLKARQESELKRTQDPRARQQLERKHQQEQKELDQKQENERRQP